MDEQVGQFQNKLQIKLLNTPSSLYVDDFT